MKKLPGHKLSAIEVKITHLKFPTNFVRNWLCSDNAFKIDIVAFFDIVRLKS